ncbi:MAG: hypothetical protein R3C56_39845 [Pirellulaceae bacterium]
MMGDAKVIGLASLMSNNRWSGPSSVSLAQPMTEASLPGESSLPESRAGQTG